MNPETIYVAPLSLVEATVADARVSHLVTLINGETLISTIWDARRWKKPSRAR